MMLWTAALAIAQDCAMYNNASAPIHWYSAPIYYSINPTNDENLSEDSVITAIQAATTAWQQPGTSVSFEYQGQTDIRSDAWEDQNTIFWSTDWLRGTQLLASALVWSDDTGSVVAFDVPINGPSFTWGTQGGEEQVDLQNALTHEIGHVLGIGHLPDPNATMFDSAIQGETNKRDLDQEDLTCLQTLYPQQENSTTNAQYPLACTSSPTTPGLISLAALIFLRTRKVNP